MSRGLKSYFSPKYEEWAFFLRDVYEGKDLINLA
jgi:hypothetical protein